MNHERHVMSYVYNMTLVLFYVLYDALQYNVTFKCIGWRGVNAAVWTGVVHLVPLCGQEWSL